MRLHGGRDGAGRLCPAQGDRPVALGTEEPGAWCAEEAGPGMGGGAARKWLVPLTGRTSCRWVLGLRGKGAHRREMGVMCRHSPQLGRVSW